MNLHSKSAPFESQTAAGEIQRALRASEERTQQALLVSRSFTFEWDVPSDEVVRSGSCASVLHLSGDDAVRDTGHSFFNRVLPDDREHFTGVLQGLTPLTPSYRIDYRILRGDRTVAVLEEIGQGSFDANGQLIRVVGVATDITERKQVENRLLLRNQQLALLAKVAQLLITGAPSEGGLLQSLFANVSRVFQVDMFRYYQARPGRRTLQLEASGGIKEEKDLLPTTLSFNQFPCGRVAESRTRLILEDLQRLGDEDGGELMRAGVLRYAGFPLIAGQRLLGTIAFFSWTAAQFQEGELETLQTICDQLAITLERSRLQEELMTSEQRLALAASGTGVGMYEYNIVTGQVLWTEQHVRMLGLKPPPEGLDPGYTYEDWAARCHPEDLPQVEADLRDCMQTGKPYEGDFRVIWPDGSVHWHSGRGIFTFNQLGHPVKLLGTTVDITERKETELRLASALNELRLTQDELLRRERFAALGQLAGGVAHELRTPLSVMRNTLAYLKLTLPSSDQETQDSLAEMERAIANSNHIITEMLDFVREPVNVREEFPLGQVIADALRSVSIPPHVRQECNFAPDATAYGCPAQVARILSNLILNAIQAMPQGGCLNVSVDQPNRGEISIVVSDTGCGIDPINLSKVFEPLFTTKTRGIGLGLAICQRYAKLNGGTLAVKSMPGEGTTFQLTLPSQASLVL